MWVVDDNPANLDMIDQSLPEAVHPVLEVRLFEDASEFLRVFEQTLRETPQHSPDFVLLDFFLGYMYGHQIVEKLLAAYTQAQRMPAVIIAHSSMPEMSALMVEHGADFSLPKIKGQATSPPITHVFGTVEALHWLKEHRRPVIPSL